MPRSTSASRRPDGTLEDVLEDNGGALTNVIGMALRLIAVVKADVARFLALDEADCWIAPDRVSSFYRVLEDGAARLGVQCLAVSHHDLSQFSGKFHIARIAGEPASGVEVQSSDPSAAWDDAQPGLRFIRLVNVQAYQDATLRLSPGVNALIGPNNRGKSTFIRALRAVFYGEARDSLVRAGAKAALVEIGVAGNSDLALHAPAPPLAGQHLVAARGGRLGRRESGACATRPAAARCRTGWPISFRIRKVEDLDVHIAHQKFPVFLLGETAVPPLRRSLDRAGGGLYPRHARDPPRALPARQRPRAQRRARTDRAWRDVGRLAGARSAQGEAFSCSRKVEGSQKLCRSSG